MPDPEWTETPVTQPPTAPPAFMTDAQFALFMSVEWTKTRAGAHGSEGIVARAKRFHTFLTNPDEEVPKA